MDGILCVSPYPSGSFASGRQLNSSFRETSQRPDLIRDGPVRHGCIMRLPEQRRRGVFMLWERNGMGPLVMYLGHPLLPYI
ncbi:hypothetical protein NPIL_457161 [Nephila pilipes]|uniref:Uncharacterized protein n=1 Tax=Nephila pilipes TaxID=299642 RepID=A0A8X6PH07_NEPPI|nr:hypothetical protein NPIL_457161 [Nephila pilipes]